MFRVLVKSKWGAPWHEQSGDLALNEAFEFAQSLAAAHFEVAVFTDGFFYWSTRRPTFNSTLIPEGS